MARAEKLVEFTEDALRDLALIFDHLAESSRGFGEAPDPGSHVRKSNQRPAPRFVSGRGTVYGASRTGPRDEG
jgi:plasmid stabilization system protein ParE